LDLTLLRVLKTREAFERFYSAVPEAGIDDKTRVILKDFEAYFDANEAVDRIEPASFRTYFAMRHPKLKPEVMATYVAQIKQLAQDPEPGVADGLRERLASVKTAARLQRALEDWDEGEGDLTKAIRQINEDHEAWLMKRKQHPLVKDRIEDILHDDANDIGFHWRLSCLNGSMRPLRTGDFGIVGARVDTGKSSWFASELTFMAPQVDQLFPDQDRHILVLNNEGPGKRLKHRLFNAALGVPTKKLVEYSKEGTVYGRFVEAQGGRDVFKILDVHDYTMGELEDIVKDLNPAIVVIDMLDNVQADRLASNGGTRTDQLLEWLYQRARIWAVKYDCAVIATSQLNGDAEGEIFPKLSMLANSRTGKAGAADFVLMIGRSNNPDLQNSRFISLPKNKKRRDGGPQDPRAEVVFDAPCSLFKDPE